MIVAASPSGGTEARVDDGALFAFAALWAGSDVEDALVESVCFSPHR